MLGTFAALWQCDDGLDSVKGFHQCIDTVLEEMKEDLDVNSVDKYGRTALHIVADGGFAECIDILVTNGAEVKMVFRCSSY